MNILNRMTFHMCENGTRLSYFLKIVLWHVMIGVNAPIPVRDITSILKPTLLHCGDIFILFLIFRSKLVTKII